MSENNIYNSPTFRLIKNNPSFMKGFSGLINFKGIIENYNTSDTEKEADTRAITSDWDAVGIDMRNAIIHNRPILEVKNG